MKERNNKEPLVSCIVATYNSALTVLETLESIKQQTYNNLELIISDDCSKDDTVAICQKWLEENKNRFIRTVLLTVERNTGVSANCNRATEASKGEWTKGIAGDDIMLPNCVMDFVNYVVENKEAMWVSSYIRKYDTHMHENNCIGRNIVISKDFFDLTTQGQLTMMARRCVLFAPSIFYNTTMIKDIGGYDEAYVAEDYPFYIRVLEKGYRCFFLPKETVCYRIHSSSCRSKGILFNYQFKKSMRQFRKDKCLKYLGRKERMGLKCLWWFDDVIEDLHLNKHTPFRTKLYKLIQSFFFRACGVVN